MNAWLGHLETILRKYSPMNISNANETALSINLNQKKLQESKMSVVRVERAVKNV
jgi:hypothetical protein